MCELYIIRDLKFTITKVLYTPGGSKFRHGSNFLSTSIQDSKYIFLIYSGKQRFIELGFNETSVYKILRYILKEKEISKLIIKIMEFIDALRTNRK